MRMNKDIGGVGQNVFSYQRIMCSLTKEKNDLGGVGQNVFSYQRIMCSLTKEKNDPGGVGQNVFSYQRMCSLTRECVLLPENVFSYYVRHVFFVVRPLFPLCSASFAPMLGLFRS